MTETVETPPSKGLRGAAVAFRLAWLLPASYAVGAKLHLVLRVLIGDFTSGHGLGPIRSIEDVLFFVIPATLVWFLARFWLHTARMAQGRVPLSRRGLALRFGATVVSLGLIGGFYVRPQRLQGERSNRDRLRFARGALAADCSRAGACPDGWKVPFIDSSSSHRLIIAAPTLWDAPWTFFPHKPSAETFVYGKRESKDTGAWAYVLESRAANQAHVYIDCTHKDSRGRAWDSY